MARKYNHCLAKVHGSSPPVSFLDELVDWALTAPDEIFATNNVYDIYSDVMKQLGPYKPTLQRKAVMLEILRVLAGRESQRDWNHGVDTSKTEKNTSDTEEAGAFQCSASSMNATLKIYVLTTLGKTDANTFITKSKSNHKFAIEYAARLLRVNVRHHGPIVHHTLHPELSRDAVTEFSGYL